MFYTFESALYLRVMPGEAPLLQKMGNLIEKVNSGHTIRLITNGRVDAKILVECDAVLLKKKGGVVVLKENLCVKKYGLKEININCYLISAYRNCTVIKLDPILSAVEKSVSIGIYEMMKEILLHAIDEFNPVLLQLNGIDEGDELSLVSPSDWDVASLPPLFTPFGYLQSTLVAGTDLRVLAPVATVTPYGDGYVVEFSPECTEEEINLLVREQLRIKKCVAFSRIMP